MENFNLYDLVCLSRMVADEVAYFSSKLDDCKISKDEIGEKFYRKEFNFYCELLDKFKKIIDMEG